MLRYVPIYGRFIGGVNVQHAIGLAKGMQHKWMPIFDRAKEGNTSHGEVMKSVAQILDDVRVIRHSNNFENMKGGYYALKASTFANDRKYVRHAYRIVRDVNDCGLEAVLDAETSEVLEVEDYYASVLGAEGLRFYKTYQMYRVDSMTRLLHDMEAGEITRYKLVRGAYYQHEIRRTGVLLPSKKHVDHVYDAAVKYIIGEMNYRGDVKLMIATHNRESIKKALALLKQCDETVQKRVRFAKLLGMGDDVEDRGSAEMCRYVPYGSLGETLPYLGRRLVENIPMLMHV